MPRETPPIPPTAHVCPICCARTQLGQPVVPARARPVTTTDLAWQFTEADALMGLRSTHGAFVDMAQSGIQSGGKSNGVEARAVEDKLLNAVGRHRCIRARLAHVTLAQEAILRAAYGQDDWTRALEDLQVRAAVRAAYGALVGVVLLTREAVEHAARRQASDYRPPRAKDRPSSPRSSTASSAARALCDRDPALAGTARGCAISAACSEDKTRRDELLEQATALLADARSVAGVVEPRAPRRVRSVQLVPREAFPSPAVPLFDGEALARG